MIRGIVISVVVIIVNHLSKCSATLDGNFTVPLDHFRPQDMRRVMFVSEWKPLSQDCVFVEVAIFLVLSTEHR